MEPKIDRYITVIVYMPGMIRYGDPVTMPVDQLDEWLANLSEGWTVEPL